MDNELVTGSVKEWFTSSSYGGVNYQNFSTFANNTIEGFKSKIGSAYTTVKTNVTTWASKVKEWFQSENSNDSWSTIAKNIVDGFANGVTSWARRCKDAVVSWGQSVLNWFEDTLDINSPSKVFYKIGGFAVAGFNNAIAQVGKTTRSVVGEWANSFTNITPTMAMAVDTSALRYYDSDAFARTISSNVETNNEISSTGFKQTMEDFYREYVEPTLNQIAEDTRRQDVTFIDPVTNSRKTIKMYCGDRTAEPYWVDDDGKPTHYRNCKVNLIDTGE